MLGPAATQTPSLIVTTDLVGAWSLESYTDATEGAETVHPLGLNPRGLLIYTPEGFMSVQLMSLGPSPIEGDQWNAGTPSEYHVRASSFIGYSGEYRFDEITATVFHMPSVSFVPILTGERLKRQVKLDGDRLTLTVVTARVEGNSVKSSLCWLRLHAHPPMPPIAPPRLG
jgi:Lipocalin-like domain